MSTVVTIRGVPINFPFEPYDLQKDYMEKVLECLQNETNGVLESPTGTGKTLSLLCSSLAWLELKKAQVQAQRQIANLEETSFLQQLNGNLSSAVGENPKYRALSGAPIIIYASRTHSQLSQAAKELKRTSYKHMKACVIGSRDQLCIHPDVIKEQSQHLKMQMCQLKVKTRSCHFYNRVESKKMDPAIRDVNIMDIEDLVTLGGTHKFCPYYMASEIKQQADIIFMPYNYLLDPMIRKTLGVELANHIIIFDEAHNVEKICEESASTQLKSSDIALAIDELTTIMKMISDEVQIFEETPKDFNAEDLCTLKQILLDLEKEIDNIDLKCGPEGTTKQAAFLFDLFEKAGINGMKMSGLITLITQYLATVGDGPFVRKGVGLQTFDDVLKIVYFSNKFNLMDKIGKCYKVHIEAEEVKKKKPGNWLSKATSKSSGKKINYWCFSPGFGMNMLMTNGLRCMILTSGTLAPLRPLISELELNIPVRLENPHIVKKDQVIVKIVPVGPDSETLNCNFHNRDNPKYINSLGRAILNLTRVIPAGLLIFFPSYPIMLKYQQFWQESGVWGSIITQKNIYVEPRDKESFNSAMHEYYEKIRDPNLKGAIFMGVCRGKVSEGLDFADANGRAVMIIGLPYPPMKDPRVILKKQYLDVCNSQDKEFLRGDDWYSLEACRAVNQAIGRVIRHKNDYGAILLLDTRFNNPRIKNQMSLWLRDRIEVAGNFGELMREIKLFFRNANDKFEALAKPDIIRVPSAELNTLPSYKSGNFDFSSSSLPTKSTLYNDGEVLVHKVGKDKNPPKRMKISLIDNKPKEDNSLHTSVKEYILMIKKKLDEPSFKSFTSATKIYKENHNIDEFISLIDVLFRNKAHLRYLIHGLENFIKPVHQAALREYCDKNV